MKSFLGLSLLIYVCCFTFLPVPIIAAGSSDEFVRIKSNCEGRPFCTPSYWAWELELAVFKGDLSLAKELAGELYNLQNDDGKWALGTDWGKTKNDFKSRSAKDAESWEIAEVANALLDYYDVSKDPTALSAVEKAAQWLKRSIIVYKNRMYLPHMPACNNLLQPHSTISAAFLFSRLEKYQDLAQQLKESGSEMNFSRLYPKQASGGRLIYELSTRKLGNYPKFQIGYYLIRMGDERGWAMIKPFELLKQDCCDRMRAYAILAFAKLGKREKAKEMAKYCFKRFKPGPGYEVALLDIISYFANDQ